MLPRYCPSASIENDFFHFFVFFLAIAFRDPFAATKECAMNE